MKSSHRHLSSACALNIPHRRCGRTTCSCGASWWRCRRCSASCRRGCGRSCGWCTASSRAYARGWWRPRRSAEGSCPPPSARTRRSPGGWAGAPRLTLRVNSLSEEVTLENTYLNANLIKMESVSEIWTYRMILDFFYSMTDNKHLASITPDDKWGWEM